MTRDELQAVVERHTETWNQRDPQALSNYHSPEGIVESPMYGTRVGRKAIEESQRAFFTSFPDATLTVEATLIDPPYVAVFSTINATHVSDFFGLPGTNRHLEFRSSRLVRLDEQGLIAHERRVYDFTGLLVQVGVLRAKPAKP
jgi:steroid delta-isomerase-like uncharacterized protein